MVLFIAFLNVKKNAIQNLATASAATPNEYCVALFDPQNKWHMLNADHHFQINWF